MEEYADLESGKEHLSETEIKTIERMYGTKTRIKNYFSFSWIKELIYGESRNPAVILFNVDLQKLTASKQIVNQMNSTLKNLKRKTEYPENRIKENIVRLERDLENIRKRTSMFQKYIGINSKIRVLCGLKTMIQMAEESLEKAEEYLRKYE